MNLDTKEVQKDQVTKPCSFCVFVRVFAIVVLLITITFYLFAKLQEQAVVKKERALIDATMRAEMP